MKKYVYYIFEKYIARVNVVENKGKFLKKEEEGKKKKTTDQASSDPTRVHYVFTFLCITSIV